MTHFQPKQKIVSFLKKKKKVKAYIEWQYLTWLVTMVSHTPGPSSYWTPRSLEAAPNLLSSRHTTA